MLLDSIQEAQLDRTAVSKFSPVEGAVATEMAEQVPEEVKEERFTALCNYSNKSLHKAQQKSVKLCR